MPLDDSNFRLSTEPAVDLTKPSLEALAYVLEHAEHWPKGWTWNFRTPVNECGTAGCALGIGMWLWGIDCGADVHRRMGIPDEDTAAYSIFISGSSDPAITPQIVAGRIRDHLAGRPIRYLIKGDQS